MARWRARSLRRLPNRLFFVLVRLFLPLLVLWVGWVVFCPRVKEDKNRRLIRLKNYDYSQAGAYFVTVCVNERWNLFGGIENGKMALSAAGEVARFTWNNLTRHNTNILLDEFVIMPNHTHGLPEIVRQFKTFSAKRINQTRKIPGRSVWQRNYYEPLLSGYNLNNSNWLSFLSSLSMSLVSVSACNIYVLLKMVTLKICRIV